MGRLRVETDANAAVTVSALPSGVEIRVARAQEQAVARRAGELADVLAVADATGVSVRLAGRASSRRRRSPSRAAADRRGPQGRREPGGAAGAARRRGRRDAREGRAVRHGARPEPVAVPKSQPPHDHWSVRVTSRYGLRLLGSATCIRKTTLPGSMCSTLPS